MDIIMIRHGESEDNLKRIFSRDSTKLTEKGRLQILDSKELLKGFDYEDIYCSPLTRTLESQELLGLVGIMEERIREIDFGAFTGMTFDEISNMYPLQAKEWLEDSINFRVPKGESVLDVYSRLEVFLKEIIEKDKDVLLICHDCVIRIILCWIFDNPDYFFKFKVENGSINVVSVEDDFKYIKKTNYKHPKK